MAMPKKKCSLRIKYKRLYHIWADIKTRCNNINSQCYSYYGGRGISICKDWIKFENFFIWAMNNGYNDTLTIDRIDNSGNYEPNNCRWVDRKLQNFNRRTKNIVHHTQE